MIQCVLGFLSIVSPRVWRHHKRLPLPKDLNPPQMKLAATKLDLSFAFPAGTCSPGAQAQADSAGQRKMVPFTTLLGINLYIYIYTKYVYMYRLMDLIMYTYRDV